MGMATHIAMDTYAHKAGEKINGEVIPIEGDDTDDVSYMEMFSKRAKSAAGSTWNSLSSTDKQWFIDRR